MRRARWAAIGLSALAGAGVVVWFATRAPVPLPPAPPVVAAADTAPAPVPKATPARSETVESDPVESEPVESEPAELSQPQLSSTGSATLLERARAGDVRAMSDIGSALLQCGAGARKLRALQIRLIENDHAGNAQMREQTLKELRDWDTYCATIPAEEHDRGLAWIEAAAATGDPGARRHFFAQALTEYEDEVAILANIDEVERRRDVARRFAREDLAACVDSVFEIQSEAFDLLGMADPVDRLALLHASVLTQPDGTESDAADAFAQEAREVDELALIEARRRGAAMHAHCAP